MQRLSCGHAIGLSLLVVISACGPPQESTVNSGNQQVSAKPPSKRPPEKTLSSVQTSPRSEPFENLQILPRDIDKDELMQQMKTFSRSLGVQCDFCHQTESNDFASDAKHQKVVARDMMRMVDRISNEQFTWEDAPRASCYLCHHGSSKPKMQP